jgi:hypothetical protein
MNIIYSNNQNNQIVLEVQVILQHILMHRFSYFTRSARGGGEPPF